jgi:hypothetical protein
MLKVISVAAISALTLAVTATSQPALARDGGAVAAGVIGGLAVGAIIGSQVNHEPNYRARYRDCHIERQEVSDRYGNYRIQRVRVCD